MTINQELLEKLFEEAKGTFGSRFRVNGSRFKIKGSWL